MYCHTANGRVKAYESLETQGDPETEHPATVGGMLGKSDLLA